MNHVRHGTIVAALACECNIFLLYSPTIEAVTLGRKMSNTATESKTTLISQFQN